MKSSVQVRARGTDFGFAACFTAIVVVVSASSLKSQECSRVLVPFDAEYAYLRGTEEPSPDDLGLPTLDWADPEFEEDEWDFGPAGFGYGDRLDQMGTVLDDMRDSYPSLYLRFRFELADPQSISTMALRLDYDDSFVAYINGVEVARRGLDGEPPPFDELGGSHESTGNLETIMLTDVSMLDDENVFAVTIHTTTLNSSDLVWIAELVADPDTCPTGLSCLWDASTGEVSLTWQNEIAAYDQIQILRRLGEGEFETLEDDIGGAQTTYIDSEPPVGSISYGVKAFDSNSECDECTPMECSLDIVRCDTLVSPGDEWNFLRGVEPGPDPEWVEEDFDDSEWETGATGIGYGDNDDATLVDDMQNSYLIVYARKIVEIEGLDDIREVRVSVLIDDGCVVHVNGAEIARYNMPGIVGDPVPNDTAATTANPDGDQADSPPPIEFVIPTDELVEGDNVFAISVHNVNLGSSDLSFIPTICAVISSDEPPPLPATSFRRGDSDNDGNVVLTDAVYILAHLVQGGPAPDCPDAADTDDDGQLVLTDGIRLLNALFQGQVPLPAPGMLECGEDSTDDALGNCTQPPVNCG